MGCNERSQILQLLSPLLFNTETQVLNIEKKYDEYLEIEQKVQKKLGIG